jgi:hypothetical protein
MAGKLQHQGREQAHGQQAAAAAWQPRTVVKGVPSLGSGHSANSSWLSESSSRMNISLLMTTTLILTICRR